MSPKPTEALKEITVWQWREWNSLVFSI